MGSLEFPSVSRPHEADKNSSQMKNWRPNKQTNITTLGRFKCSAILRFTCAQVAPLPPI